MKKANLFFILITLSCLAKSQSAQVAFDSTKFNQGLALATYFLSCETYNQAAVDRYKRIEDISAIEWVSYPENNKWRTVGLISTGNTFSITKNLQYDSLGQFTELPPLFDSAAISSTGSALAFASNRFQLIRDTCNLYFNSFVQTNADQTLSVWYLPAFQPSGQAIYGCEWEYIFDKTGKNLIKENVFTNRLTGVWIGQPRELWLNYRNTDKPTPGSIFFALSFRDYFTRLRIDTRISTSTIARDATGQYIWTHKMK